MPSISKYIAELEPERPPSFTASGSISSGNIVALRNDGNIEVVTSSSNSTLWIGIANETVSSGSSCEVCIKGFIGSSLSGLTVNSVYYVNDNGSIGTGSTTNGKIGRAVSSTELLVTEGN